MSCENCKLKSLAYKPCQMGTGNRKKAKIVVVQENPYDFENKREEYMSGRAGRLFRSALVEVGIDPEEVYFTAVVKCPTPDDRLPDKKEVNDCIDFLLAELDVIQPLVVIPTGNLSLTALKCKTGITKQRGKLFSHEDGFKIFPVIHPNMVLKQPKWMEFFVQDMNNLAKVYENLLSGGTGYISDSIKDIEEEYVYGETFEETVTELWRFINLPAGTDVIFDIEAVKTNPYITKVECSKSVQEKYPDSTKPKLIAVGLSDRPGYGFAIPLYHRETPFSGNQIGTIIKLLRKLFSRTDLNFGGHNVKFDKKWFKAQCGVDIPKFRWDTILLHYLTVTEEKGTHGLKDLAWLYTNMGGYDDDLEGMAPKGVDEGNYDLIPWDILKQYLCGDVDCTQRILQALKPNIEEGSQEEWIWDNLMVPGSDALQDIEETGVYVNPQWLERLEKTYPEEIARLEEKLHEYPEVIEIERENKAKWDERVAIGLLKKPQRTAEQQKKFEIYKKFDPSKGGIAFNFGSSAQLKELLFNRMKLRTVILTEKGEMSTNDDSLKFMEKQHPIIGTLVEFRKVNHLYNNFVASMRSMMDENGFIHPTYQLFGTVTGRLSSIEPNAQQFPRHVYNPLLFQYSNDIKTLFTSRFGDDGCVFQFDYSQLELRILAVMSQDPTLIGLYRSGADLHKAVASEAFGVPIEEVTKDQRTASKKIQFGVVYQESPRGLSEDLRSEGIDMSEEACEQFINRYFKRFPKVEKWIKDTKRFVKRNKYVVTKTGRKRNLPSIDSSERSIANEAERQSVNAPIQSTGSDCTLQAIIQINKWLKETGKKTRIVITVHDSLVFDAPKDEVVEVARKVKHIMEHLAEYNEYYKFLGDVPIVAEMEIGYSYGQSFECDIDDIVEAGGVDEYLSMQLDKKAEGEQKLFEEMEEKGEQIPRYVSCYWDKIS